MKQKKNLWLLLILLAVMLAALCLYFHYSDKASAGEKSITLDIIFAEGSLKRRTINTTEENLRAALEAEGLIAGDESAYGMFVKTVDGVTANEDEEEWWCLTKNGEQHNSGVDTTVIADGDKYEFTLKTGW